MLRPVCCVLLLSSTAFAAETMRIAVQQETAQAEVVADALWVGTDVDDAPMAPLGRARAVIAASKGHLVVDGEAVSDSSLRLRGDDEDAAISINGVDHGVHLFAR